MHIFYLLLFFWFTPVYAASPEPPIRFGLTAVILTENLRFLDQWSDYLKNKLNRDVEFVLRKSYQDVMGLLDSGDIEFAWICGYPYIQPKSSDILQLLTVPIYRGQPRYYSYVIVPHDSTYKHFSDLKGKVFAFSDPDSNSGFLYPTYLLAETSRTPETFFRKTFFTFNHAETIQAVADQVANGGAVDSYIWESLAVSRPDITEKTRIISKSQSFGFPPIVSRLGLNTDTVSLMKSVLESMHEDTTGRALLDRLKLDGFGDYSDSLFNDIRAMAKRVQRTHSKFSLSPTD